MYACRTVLIIALQYQNEKLLWFFTCALWLSFLVFKNTGFSIVKLPPECLIGSINSNKLLFHIGSTVAINTVSPKHQEMEPRVCQRKAGYVLIIVSIIISFMVTSSRRNNELVNTLSSMPLRLVNHILTVDEVTSGFYQMQHLRDVASPRRQYLSKPYL